MRNEPQQPSTADTGGHLTAGLTRWQTIG
ncbi:MAG: hypothetical protein QOH92_1180, partial [Chloroflexota bacterium]|nr:hypothetical protein [Chloroflexota bacterium]